MPGTTIRARLAAIPAWSWLLLIAGSLRLINLGGQSLWYDETFTAWVVKLPFKQMMQAIQGDVHPPLFYWIEWVVSGLLGNSEAALRLPSAIFGTIAVILLWRVALAVKFEARTAFVAGLIAAVLPGSLYYSQEARMYALLLCALLGALLCAIEGRWVLYAVCTAVAVYSQNLGLISVAVLNVAVLIVLAWSERGRGISSIIKVFSHPVMAMAVVVALWIPWAFVEIKQASAMAQGFWLTPLTLPSTLEPILKLTMGEQTTPSLAFGSYAVALGMVGVGLWFSRTWLRSRSGALVLSVMIGVPVVMAIISWLWRSIYLPRAMIGSVYLVALLWGYVLCHLPRPDRRVAQAVLIPMLAVTLVANYFPNQTTRVDWRGRMAEINAQWTSGDIIYYGSINAAIAVGYYAQGDDYAMRHEAGDLNQSMSPETQAAFGFREVDFDKLALMGYSRAWLVVGINPLSNVGEINEIHRILAKYPNKLIKTYSKSALAEESMYLIDLEVSNVGITR